MFPCEADLNLYTAKRLPRWAQTMRAKVRWELAELVDLCVNTHADVWLTSGENAAQNTMALITRQLRAGAPRRAVAARLEQIADEYEDQSKTGRSGMGDLRRAGFARKWANRLRQADGK